jgi:hypothetical protein
MTTITIHNYEEYVIDYIDGNMNALESAQLLLFLAQHPSLQAEFDMLKIAVSITNDEQKYDAKKSLKKEINYTNNDVIAYLENDLTPAETDAFATEIDTNQTLNKNVNAFKHTFIMADKRVVYAYKEKLKKKNKVILLFAYAAAASVIVLFLINIVWNTSIINNTKNNLTQKNTRPIPTLITTSIANDNTIALQSPTTITINNIKNSFNKNSTVNTNSHPTNTTIITTTNTNNDSRNELTGTTITDTTLNNINTATKIELANVNNETAFDNELNELTTIYSQETIANYATESNKPNYYTLLDITKQRVAKLLHLKNKRNANGALVAYQVSIAEFEFYKTMPSKK